MFCKRREMGLQLLGTAEGEVSVVLLGAMILVMQTRQRFAHSLLLPGVLALGAAALTLILLKKF